MAELGGRHHLAETAELDRLQAAAGRRARDMMPADVVGIAHAFIEGDGHAARRRHLGHAIDVVCRDRLLEEREPQALDLADVAPRFVPAPALVGIGADKLGAVQFAADGGRARGIGLGVGDAHLDLERRITRSPLRERLGDIAGLDAGGERP